MLLSIDTILTLSDAEFSRVVLSSNLKPADILLVITRLEQEVLVKIEAKDGKQSERYQFYKRCLRIMYLAMQAEERINFWRDACIKEKIDAEHMRDRAAFYYNELMKYKAIEEIIDAGDLDKYIESVQKKQKTL